MGLSHGPPETTIKQWMDWRFHRHHPISPQADGLRSSHKIHGFFPSIPTVHGKKQVQNPRKSLKIPKIRSIFSSRSRRNLFAFRPWPWSFKAPTTTRRLSRVALDVGCRGWWRRHRRRCSCRGRMLWEMQRRWQHRRDMAGWEVSGCFLICFSWKMMRNDEPAIQGSFIRNLYRAFEGEIQPRSLFLALMGGGWYAKIWLNRASTVASGWGNTTGIRRR